MSETTVPKNILEELLRVLSRKPFVNPWQRRFIKISYWMLALWGVAVAGVLFAALIALKTPGLILFKASYFFMMVSVISAGLSSLVPAISQLLEYLRHPEQAELEFVLDSINKEADLVAGLAKKYERHDLEYVQERVALEVTQIRTWSALWIGVLDKVGLIPLAVTAYLYLSKFEVDKMPGLSEVPGGLWISIVGLVFLYLRGASQRGTCLELDRFCLVLKHALERKKLKQPVLNADAPIQTNMGSPSLATE